MILNFKRKEFKGTVIDVYNHRKHLMLENRLRNKLNKLSKKYDTYDLIPLNTNRVLLKVSNNLPFKLDKYKKIIKEQKKYSNLLLPIPTKVLIKITQEDLFIELEIIKHYIK